ncbi:MAG: hypothetical protein J2P17_18590, partial [Mycobacterium sp.]|nr:hypothetical protein [Mycobacterium sp.]
MRKRKSILVLAALIACTLATSLGVSTAQAGNTVNKTINPDSWVYGPRFGPPAGCTWLQCPLDKTWNPVKRKLMQGQDVYGGTVLTTDPDSYCKIANSGQYDFTWTEIQHAQATWESASKEWATCPGGAVPSGTGAVPGARIAAVPDTRYAA